MRLSIKPQTIHRKPSTPNHKPGRRKLSCRILAKPEVIDDEWKHAQGCCSCCTPAQCPASSSSSPQPACASQLQRHNCHNCRAAVGGSRLEILCLMCTIRCFLLAVLTFVFSIDQRASMFVFWCCARVLRFCGVASWCCKPHLSCRRHWSELAEQGA